MAGKKCLDDVCKNIQLTIKSEKRETLNAVNIVKVNGKMWQESE